MKYESKIYVAGHNALVGSAIGRCLINSGYTNLILKSSKELNLERQTEVEQFFCEYQPEYVFLVAAKVGGINANNKYPAEFIYKNLMIQSNVINTSLLYGVKKLLFLGSSCIYPKESKQPIKEEYLFDGKLEPTNEAYALAKIAGIRMCSFYRKQYNVDFISAMPTNLYGINDNFDLETSHVLPAIIRKIHEAKKKQSKKYYSLGNR
jgi:GDP-L-fucose synthase